MFGEFGPNSVAVSKRPASSNFSILCLGTCFNISQALLKMKHDCNQAGYISNTIMHDLAKISVLYLGTLFSGPNVESIFYTPCYVTFYIIVC